MKHQEAQLRAINSRRPDPGRLLEVGAAHGEFLNLARSVGWTVAGIEPSRAACRAAAERFGLELIPTTLEGYTAEEPFDVVFLSHVFEHVPEPSDALDAIGRLLSPGGLLVIEVPNQFEAWVSRLISIVRRGRPMSRTLYSIHHTLFFGPRQLSQVLCQRGYEVELSTHFTADFSGDFKHRIMGAVDFVADRFARQGRVIQALATSHSAGAETPSSA